MKTASLSIVNQRAPLWMASLLLLIAAVWSGQVLAKECPPLLRHSFPSLQDGSPQNLCQYQGKVILVVNTASYCGFTDQYGGLEALNRKYKDQGLVVLGFPSNDFGNQEPGDSKKIATFCRLTYNVEFPMLEKSHVVGKQRNAFYAELERRTQRKPAWNFHKYLIDHAGKRVESFESAVAPDDKRLLESLHRMLDARKKLVRRT